MPIELLWASCLFCFFYVSCCIFLPYSSYLSNFERFSVSFFHSRVLFWSVHVLIVVHQIFVTMFLFLTLFIFLFFYFYVSRLFHNLICSYLPLECYTDLLMYFSYVWTVSHFRRIYWLCFIFSSYNCLYKFYWWHFGYSKC